MAVFNKKLVTFLVAMVLGASAPMLWATQENSGLPEKRVAGKPRVLFTTDSNSQKQSYSRDAGKELYLKLTYAVLIIIVLGVITIYVSKKLLPKITNPSGKKIRVIETTYLGQRRALHLIEIGPRKLLIGSTNESITKLADLNDIPMELSSGDMEMLKNVTKERRE